MGFSTPPPAGNGASAERGGAPGEMVVSQKVPWYLPRRYLDHFLPPKSHPEEVLYLDPLG